MSVLNVVDSKEANPWMSREEYKTAMRILTWMEKTQFCRQD